MSDALGWVAAGLTVATFSCTQPVGLRLCALGANLAFMGYGATSGLWPVLVLHAVLLPINAMRLMQAQAQAVRGTDRPEEPALTEGAGRPLAGTKE